MIERVFEMNVIGKSLLFDVQNNDLPYDDEKVQFFIPIALNFTNFDWLKLIADNTLIEEDAVIVKNFLDKAKALAEINNANLEKEMRDHGVL